MSDELKPCPFCGSRADRIDFGPGDAENAGGSCIACSHCGSSGPVEFGYKENFISNWNRRTQPPAVGVDVLKRVPSVMEGALEAFEAHYEASSEDPAMATEVGIWCSAWKAARIDAALRTGGGA